MDYTKTDEQLKNIAEGLRELDKENNAFLSIRLNEENLEIAMNMVGTVPKMIAIAMHEHPKFKDVIFKAMTNYTLVKLSGGHKPEDCMKCKETDCKVRKAEYKAE